MKSRIFRIRPKKVGGAPGDLVHVGEKKKSEASLEIFSYDARGLTRTQDATLDQCLDLAEAPGVNWINVDGLHDVALVERLGQGFGIHPLVLEDILNTEHRPKFEESESYLFVVLKMLPVDGGVNEVEPEQFSLILTANCVLSFQEQPGDVFTGVRGRLLSGKGRIRQRGPDYLAYALIDSIVDSHFLILERFGDDIEKLEEELITDPTQETLQKIHHYRRELIMLRKSIWPLREVISALHRNDTDLIAETTQIYLQDVYDHTIQVVDTVETFRDIIAGFLDLYLSSVSNRMNEVMKVLTIIATIFIPLTFLAGIYGMNFEHMPELGWRWSYAVFWAIIVTLGVGLVAYFRHKKWL
ncbi:MAG: magnesium/cobalt transporter CorA [Desulfuromonadales bacterium]|nr:magnesium/cobalt transporter CorA [Desulfuromonadales bacterium]NIS43220.1 magnesium/cobalt transporter CorA [Desulfuromonadales bacterium]